jgi:hypothetical protein
MLTAAGRCFLATAVYAVVLAAMLIFAAVIIQEFPAGSSSGITTACSHSSYSLYHAA